MSQKSDSPRSGAASQTSRRSSNVSQSATSSGQQSPSGRRRQNPRANNNNKGRHNKIYRAPATPLPDERLEMERSFVLDSSATSSISYDYSKTNPKLGPVLPPYNSQLDRHTQNYFMYHGVDRTLRKTIKQRDDRDYPIGTSIDGPVMDRFHSSGAGYRYLSSRNQFGAGHSRETIDGHSQFMEGIKPVVGYNGFYGFRRNTPWLRMEPSPFGTATLSKTQASRKEVMRHTEAAM